jgi:hypothetical protein
MWKDGADGGDEDDTYPTWQCTYMGLGIWDKVDETVNTASLVKVSSKSKYTACIPSDSHSLTSSSEDSQSPGTPFHSSVALKGNRDTTDATPASAR